MRITIENTSKIVDLNGIPARVWEGHTESGIKVHAFITRITVDKNRDTSEFERELAEVSPPSPEVVAYPGRLIL